MTSLKGFGLGLASAAALALGCAVATAQVDPRFVITGEVAATIGEMNMINAATAEAIAKACERMATERGQSPVIVILDNFGNKVHQHRTDGAARYTAIHTAELKANTAMQTRRLTSLRQAGVDRDPIRAVREFGLGFFPTSGGLPIWVGNQIIGFIGVGGMAPRPPEWSDEICAHNAMEEVIGAQPPLS